MASLSNVCLAQRLFLPFNSGFAPMTDLSLKVFLPEKKGRQTRYLELAEETRTMILYVSPHKLVKTLAN
jgi:16S rRNA (cytidine1402-2'-O)-methyltransferase